MKAVYADVVAGLRHPDKRRWLLEFLVRHERVHVAMTLLLGIIGIVGLGLLASRAVAALNLAGAGAADSSIEDGGGGGGGGSGMGGDDYDNIAMSLQEAYLQGFTDATAGKDSAPPAKGTRAYDPTAEARNAAYEAGGGGYAHAAAADSAVGGGFGVGSLFSLFILASSLYRLGGGGGGGGWSLPMAIASMKANPMQGVMMLLMLSRLF